LPEHPLESTIELSYGTKAVVHGRLSWLWKSGTEEERQAVLAYVEEERPKSAPPVP
jgi:hypothetical protein